MISNPSMFSRGALNFVAVPIHRSIVVSCTYALVYKWQREVLVRWRLTKGEHQQWRLTIPFDRKTPSWKQYKLWSSLANFTKCISFASSLDYYNASCCSKVRTHNYLVRNAEVSVPFTSAIDATVQLLTCTLVRVSACRSAFTIVFARSRATRIIICMKGTQWKPKYENQYTSTNFTDL